MRFFRWVAAWPWRVKTAVVFGILFLVFAFLNDDTVTIHLGFGKVEMRMYVALTISGVLGFVPGLVMGHYGAARRALRKAEKL